MTHRKSKRGCSVFILNDALPHTIRAQRFFSVYSMPPRPQVQQPCNVRFYASPIVGVQQIASANVLQPTFAGAYINGMPLRYGIKLPQGVLSFQADAQPNAPIAIYYE